MIPTWLRPLTLLCQAINLKNSIQRKIPMAKIKVKLRFRMFALPTLPTRDVPEHRRCYAHNFHLMIKDVPTSKMCWERQKIFSCYCVFRNEKSLQTPTKMELNSQINMIRYVLNISEKLNELDTGRLTSSDRKPKNDPCSILQSFWNKGPKIMQCVCQLSQSCASESWEPIEDSIYKIYNNMDATLKSSIKRQMPAYKTYEAYILAAILDPRFKMTRITDENRQI